MAEHAKLSPSSSHRWIHCPGSFQLCEDMPKSEDKTAAMEGTAAHALNDYCIAKGWFQVPPALLGEKFVFEFNHEPATIVVTNEIVKHCNLYLNVVFSEAEKLLTLEGKRPVMRIEQRIDLSHVQEGIFGTSDAVLEAARVLVVIDFKYGFVPVHLDRRQHIDEQMLCYACGAAHENLWLQDTIRLVVVQPRCERVPNVQQLEISAVAVRQWQEDVLRPAVDRITRKDPTLQAGDWCRGCAAIAQCPAFRDKAQELTHRDFSAPADNFKPIVPITDEELAHVLDWESVIRHWLMKVKVKATARGCVGHKLPGYKIVYGRGSRDWPLAEDKYENQIQMLVDAGLTEEEALRCYTPPALLSPAQTEELSVQHKAVVAKLAVKHPGQLTIAPESDRRKAVPPGSEFAEYAVPEGPDND